MGLYVFQKIEIWTPIWDPHGLPRASKIDPGALKITIFDLPGSVYDSGDDFWGQKNDFVAHFGGLGPPKSTQKSKKIEFENLHVFYIDFFMVWAWFWRGFSMFF